MRMLSMRKKHLLVLGLIGICFLFSCKKTASPNPEPEPKYEFRQDGTLEIISPEGLKKATFNIEIAEKELERMQGLKYREKMADNEAMLFIFEYPDIYDFWMQDTYLPLDMLFIAADSTINDIYENAVPFSEKRITPHHPHQYVLEVNAGIVKKSGIKTGDKIIWKRPS